MKNTKPIRKVLSLVLTFVMVFGSFGGTGIFAATESNVKTNGSVSWEKVENGLYPTTYETESFAPEVDDTPEYKDTDVVRVSIVLKADATIKKFATENIAKNTKAIKYRADLEKQQAKLADKISKKVLGGEALDVAANLTLAANIVSAYVEYGKIAEIEALSDVKAVVIETQYEAQKASESDAPNMGPSSGMIGSGAVWAEGYTGAGSKVAIVDTGVDDDHQSFAAAGYEYAMKQNAEAAGMSLEEYKASVGVLTAADVAAVWDQLNASGFADTDVNKAYLSSKIPYAVNYVDKNMVINHDSDGQGEHGSHVTGIAAGNRYIANGDKFEDALTYAGSQGVAPDAQIVTMKVFGARGGAYDSDYMLAIEDAIILGCDSVNLSLGSSAPGRESAGTYEGIMNDITASGTVVVMSAGNSGNWFENSYYGYLFAEDVAIDTVGSPGSFTNTLAVASIDNDGATGMPLKFGDLVSFYTETSGYTNPPIAATIPGNNEYVFFENTGVDGAGNDLIAPYADVVKGKVVMVYRGDSSFYQKMDAAAAAGASACIIVNNQAGTINMDLSNATSHIPCVSITQKDGDIVKTKSTKQDAGYYTGTVEVSTTLQGGNFNSEYYTMSDFSSWGVPGSLELKPEITAPGGNIYSVNGAIAGGKSYELMSGTSMAAPQTTGMVALFGQYLRENGLEDLGYSARQLAISLLMSTAKPVMEDYAGDTNGAGEPDGYYSVLKQGSGLAQIDKAIAAKTFIMMADNATKSAADGKIKVELGDDPERKGVYTFGFSINNMEDEAKCFDLYADMFTQDVFGSAYGAMLDTWTTPLDFTAVWKVNGETVVPNADIALYDFDGDGDVDEDDGQALLDLATTVRESIFNAEYADFDADGDIDTYDAYLFFKTLSEGAVIVPASGKIDVECTITLKNIDEYDYAGAFVEGYVYAEEISTEEGVEGDLHSIPVLGYYGSWTEPGMFDLGSYNEYEAKTETRLPYLYGVTRTKNENVLAVRYPGAARDTNFGGNPVVADKKFMPERSALSAENGTQLSKFTYTQIRNAEQGQIKIVDEDGTEIYKANMGSKSSAYYYTNQSKWMATSSSQNLGFVFKGAEDNKKASFCFTLVPEYYTIGGQTVDYSTLGAGATKKIDFTVDNTAPEAVKMELATDLLNGSKSINLVAKDNQYVAAVVVLDNAGTTIAKFGSDANAAAGAETAYNIPLGNQQKVVIQIYDYAYNMSTYKVNVGGNTEPIPVTGITVTPEEATLLVSETTTLKAEVTPTDADNTEVIWTSSDEKVATVTKTGVVTAVAPGTATITATSAENAEIFDTAEITVEVVDVTLYGVLQDAAGTPETFTWNMATDKTWKKGVELSSDINAFTDDWASYYPDSFGNLHDAGYLMDSAGVLHIVSLNTGEELFKSDAAAAFGAPMYDLSLAYFNNIMDVTGTTIQVGVYGGYVLYSEDLGNTFTSGWNLGQYFPIYGGGTEFQAITWVGKTQELNDETNEYEDFDVFYAINDAGMIWVVELNFKTGNAWFGYVDSGLDLSWPGYDGNSYCSLCLGDDGNYYLSYFNGTTNEIYQLMEDAEGFTSRRIGDVGDDVWPCSIYNAISNEDLADGDKVVREANVKAPMKFSAQAAEFKAETNAKGGLNAYTAAAPAAPVFVKGGEAEVLGSTSEASATVTLKATDEEGNDVDSTNGLFTVTWDPEALELVDCEVFADYESVKIEEGKAIIGYVSLDGIPAGEDVAELTFKLKGHPAVVTVDHSEESENEIEFTEELCVFDHAFTEVVGAKEATCTEDGYTGDVVCIDCGEVLEEGEVIPALGHDFDTENPEFVWNEDKSECKIVFTCTRCGEEEEFDCEVTEEIVKEATETEPGLKKIIATYTDEEGHVYTEIIEVVIPVKTSPETGLVLSGIGALGALGAAAYVFGRKRKEDEE